MISSRTTDTLKTMVDEEAREWKFYPNVRKDPDAEVASEEPEAYQHLGICTVSSTRIEIAENSNGRRIDKMTARKTINYFYQNSPDLTIRLQIQAKLIIDYDYFLGTVEEMIF